MKTITDRAAKYKDTRLAAVQAHRDDWMRRAMSAEAALADARKALAALNQVGMTYEQAVAVEAVEAALRPREVPRK